MKNKLQLILLFNFAFSVASNAKEIHETTKIRSNTSTQFVGCPNSTAQVDLAVNNVRAHILNGGDLWWDPVSQVNTYEVPIGSGINSLFAGAIWIGGFDASGSLKVAAQTYRQQGANDFWPGPISKDPVTDSLSITNSRCLQFDRFYGVSKQDIQNFVNGGSPTQEIIDYPGNGNVANGELPLLAPFIDINNDGVYDYTQGDYPAYNFSGNYPFDSTTNSYICNDYLFGDQGYWWVFNDIGNTKTETNSYPIGLEIRAQALAFNAPNSSVNNTTFYKYQIINRSSDGLNQCYIGQWVDPDLGDATDDYVGSDVGRGLGFCYNSDADDDASAGGYGLNPPAIGTDFLQGPLADFSDGIDNDLDSLYDEPGEQCAMTKFVYYNNTNNTPDGNPSVADDYYQYLAGKWLDGILITHGNGGRTAGDPPCNYMFPGTTDPLFTDDWTMASAGFSGGDMRYLQSAGTFSLPPGAVNYVTVAVVWARDSAGPLSSVSALLAADDNAQSLFNNCFTPVGIKENFSVTNVTCSPNPFSEQTTISFNNPDHHNITLHVYDLKGRLVRNLNATTGNSFKFEKNELHSGIYLYNLQSENKSIYSGKIVVQ